jgi:hypothetical protein
MSDSGSLYLESMDDTWANVVLQPLVFLSGLERRHFGRKYPGKPRLLVTAVKPKIRLTGLSRVCPRVTEKTLGNPLVDTHVLRGRVEAKIEQLEQICCC